MDDKYAALRKALAEPITPLPWVWWTSNSHNRLSSETTGKDGGVLCAVKASDGFPIINSKQYDRALIVEAVNSVADLLAERDALLADKRRMDWVEKQAAMGGAFGILGRESSDEEKEVLVRDTFDDWFLAKTVRAAIDAAMPTGDSGAK